MEHEECRELDRCIAEMIEPREGLPTSVSYAISPQGGWKRGLGFGGVWEPRHFTVEWDAVEASLDAMQKLIAARVGKKEWRLSRTVDHETGRELLIKRDIAPPTGGEENR